MDTKKLKYIGKAVLLYGTVLYFFIYIISAESLTEYKPLYAFLGLMLLLILLVICRKVFKGDNLRDYIPNWF